MGVVKWGKTLDDLTEKQMFNRVTSEENIRLSEIKSNGGYMVVRGFFMTKF